MKKIAFPLLALLSFLFLLSSCNGYGDKVDREYLEVYYKDGVDKATAQKTLDFLYPNWMAADGTETPKKSVQLTKDGDTLYFRMVTNKEKVTTVDDNLMYSLANVFSDSLYGGIPVNIQLTDDKFKTERTFHFQKMEVGE